MSTETKTTVRHLWYTRRGSEIRGPFPQGLITRYLLIGRIQLDDQISPDQMRWSPVREFPELIPDELKGDPNDPAVAEKLRLARRREDERAAGDRRNLEKPEGDERRRTERRQPEPSDLLQHRNIKTSLVNERKSQREPTRWPAIIGVVVVMAAITVGAFVFMPAPVKLKLECEAPPGPQVNWSNCRFEGIMLNNVNLTGAKMGNANLNGAHLDNATLTGSDLSYANFSRAEMRGANATNAVWVGTILRNAKLERIDLSGANLSYAILQGTDLTGANLRNANLTKADLTNAILEGANLDGANLTGAIWIDRETCGEESVGKCVK